MGMEQIRTKQMMKQEKEESRNEGGDLKNRVWKQSKGRPEEWKEEKTLELRHRDKNETNNERK